MAMTTQDDGELGQPGDDDAKKRAARIERGKHVRRKPGPWPDDVDDVELARALAQVPPWWLLGALCKKFKAADAPPLARNPADAPWTYLGKSDRDHYGSASGGRFCLCTRCEARRAEGTAAPWVQLFTWVYPADPKATPPRPRRTTCRIGQCTACGAGYWTEVATP